MTTINNAEIHQNSFFSGLVEKDIDFILQDFTVSHFKKSELICQADKEADCIYLVVKGTVHVEVDNEVVAELSAGDFLGMMAFIKNERFRNANIIANDDVDIVVVDYEKLEDFKKEHPAEFSKVLSRVSESWVQRIEKRNLLLAKQLKRTQSLISFFCATVFISIIIVLAARLSSTYISTASSTTWISSIELLFFVIFYSLMIRYSSFPLKIFGFSLKSWKKDIIEALRWSVVFLITAVLIKWCYIQFSTGNTALFELPYRRHTLGYSIILVVVYGLFCFAQEFIARGVMQGILMLMARNTFQKIRAIFITVLTFAASHLHLPSLWYAAAVIVPGIFWSILYEKQERRLLGVCVSHTIIGVVFLNFIGWNAALV